MPTLLTPFQTNALYLPAPKQVVEAMADFRKVPYFDKKVGRIRHADNPYISENMLSHPFQNQHLSLEKGVHLHFVLPPSLIAPIKRLNKDTGRKGEDDYPPAPNRWLVVKNGGASKWVVESDYLWAEDASYEQTRHSVTILLSKAAIQQQPQSNVRFRYIGRSYALEDWLNTGEQGSYWRDFYGESITALGYNEPTFASFYPNCRSVFGFHDATGQKGDKYEVWGWYSQSSDNALLTEFYQSDAIFEPYSSFWTLTQEVQKAIEKTASDQAPALLTQFKERLKALAYQAAGGGLPIFNPLAFNAAEKKIDSLKTLKALQKHLQEKHIADLAQIKVKAFEEDMGWTIQNLKNKQKPELPQAFLFHSRLHIGEQIEAAPATNKAVKGIAIGNTGTEALSAYLAEEIDPKRQTDIEDQLEAIQFEHLHDQKLDLGYKFEEARHQKGFNPRVSGKIWQLDIEDRSTSQQQVADASASKTLDNLLEDSNIAAQRQQLAELLSKLNFLQGQYDRQQGIIHSKQHQLFADWYKYMLCAHPPLDRSTIYPKADTVMRFLNQRVIKDLHQYIEKTEILFSDSQDQLRQIAPMNVLSKAQNLTDLANIYHQIRQDTQILYRQKVKAWAEQAAKPKDFLSLRAVENAILKHWSSSQNSPLLSPTSSLPKPLTAAWTKPSNAQELSKMADKDLAKWLLGLAQIQEFKKWYPTATKKKSPLGGLGGLFGKKKTKTDPIAEVLKKHKKEGIQALLQSLNSIANIDADAQKKLQSLKLLQLKPADLAQSTDLLRLYQLIPNKWLNTIDETRIRKLLQALQVDLVNQLDFLVLVKWICSLSIEKSIKALDFITPVLTQETAIQTWIAGLKQADEKTTFDAALKNMKEQYEQHWEKVFAPLPADSLLKQWVEATKQITTFEEFKGIYPEIVKNNPNHPEQSSLLGTWLTRLTTSKTWKQAQQNVKNSEQHLNKLLKLAYLKPYFKNLFLQQESLSNTFEICFQFLAIHFDAQALQKRLKAELRPIEGAKSPMSLFLEKSLPKEDINKRIQEIEATEDIADLKKKESGIRTFLEKQKKSFALTGKKNETAFNTNLARLKDLADLQKLLNDLKIYRKQAPKKLGISAFRGAFLSIISGAGVNYLPKGSFLEQFMVTFYDIHREVHLLNRSILQKIQEKIDKPLPKGAKPPPKNPLKKGNTEKVWKYPKLQGKKYQFRLLNKPAPRYYEAKEPVVLISGAVTNSSLPTLVDEQKNLEKSYLETFQFYASGSTDKKKIQELADKGLASTQELPQWELKKDFWNPLLLEWAVDYIPINDPSINAHYKKDFIQEDFELCVATPDFTIQANKAEHIEQLLSKQYRHYTGSTLLTPNAPAVLRKQVKNYLSHKDTAKNPDQYAELKAALERLNAPELSVLSQSLGGFKQALLMRKQTMQLEVDDPISLPQYIPLVHNIRQYIGEAIRSAPEPKHYFNPIRAGALSVDELRLVDSFGQVRSVYNDHLKKNGARKIIASNTLKLSKVAENTNDLDMEYLASKNFDAVLMPRVVQPLRLDVRWIAAMDDQKVSANDKGSSPICGWIVPNFLNLTLVLFDTDGNLLGEMGLFERKGKQVLKLIPPPGTNAFTKETLANPHLKNMVSYFQLKGVDYFNEFLQLIHESVMYSDPKNFAQHTELAMLVGRPLALVRAKVNFELMEDYAIDQDWNMFQKDLLNMNSRAYKRTTYDFEKVEIPIQLGDYRQLNDGLFGFWTVGGKDVSAIDEEDKFYSSYQLGYQKKEGWVMKQSLDGKPIFLNMLFDPRGELNVFSGVMPVKTIDIPAEHYRKALEKMKIYFALGPFLTPKDQFKIPIPQSSTFEWHWVWQQDSTLREVATRPSIRKVVLQKAWQDAKMPNSQALWDGLLQNKWIKMDKEKSVREAIMNLNLEERTELPKELKAWETLIQKVLPEPKIKEKAYLSKNAFVKAWKASKLKQEDVVWKLLLKSKWLLNEESPSTQIYVNEDLESRDKLPDNLQKQKATIEKIVQAVIDQKRPILKKASFEKSWEEAQRKESEQVWLSLLKLQWLIEIPDSSTRAYINYDTHIRKSFDEKTPLQTGDETLITTIFDRKYEGIAEVVTDPHFGQMELREGWLKLMNEF